MTPVVPPVRTPHVTSRPVALLLLAVCLFGLSGCFWFTSRARGDELELNVSSLTKQVKTLERQLESDREDGPFASFGSRVFYGLMRRYAIPTMPPRGFDFFLIDRVVADFIVQAQEKNSFIQGHLLWTGYEPAVIHYKRMRREHGKSKWTFWRKVKYFTDGLVTYSIAPIRLITMIGLFVSMAAFVYTAVVYINFFAGGAPMTGWTPLMMCMLFIGGVQLVMLGIIGEYLWRNYDESRALPNYIVERVLDSESGTDGA